MKIGPRWQLPLFLGMEGILYALLLVLDLSGRWDWSVSVKYAAVAFCLLFSLGGEALMTAAMALTLLSDTFLLLLDARYLAGVASFCVVQALYLIRIRRLGGWPLPLCASVRAGLLLAALALLAALELLGPLTALTALYFTQLAANAAESWTLLRRGRRHRIFSAGLHLFVGCDLCVGLHNLPGLLGITAAGGLFPCAAVGIWLFYLPSQVLLALSGREEFFRKGGMP